MSATFKLRAHPALGDLYAVWRRAHVLMAICGPIPLELIATIDLANCRYEDPRQAGLEREFLQKGLSFYEKLIQPGNAEPAARFQTGKAYRRAGDLQEKLGRHAEAEEAYSRAVKLLEALADQNIPFVVKGKSDVCSLSRHRLDALGAPELDGAVVTARGEDQSIG